MDREKELTKKERPLGSMQAHIWVGDHTVAKDRVVSVIKQQVCVQGGCNRCAQCQLVIQEQHHAALWLYPKKNYTLDQLDPIFSKLSFGLDEQEQFFIVIQKADFLSQSCANSLLKVLEEPPRGYYFFLLVERLDDLLPTIRSRCMVHRLHGVGSVGMQQDLFEFFTSTKGYNPAAFTQCLTQSNINERETVELIDRLHTFWMKQYKEMVMKNNATEQNAIKQIVAIFERSSMMLPMPGSAKLFWKNVYLQIKTLFQ